MSSFTWLHVSDLHLGAPSHRWLWPQLRAQFIDDAVGLARRLGRLDFVFATGDLVHAGSPEQYVGVRESLRQLWESLEAHGLRPQLLCVPGNHDLARPDSQSAAVRALRAWHDDPDLRDHFWESPDNEYRQLVSECFRPYEDWVTSLPLPTPNGTAGLLPGDFSSVLTLPDLRLGVVGLNTAFLHLEEGDYRKRLEVDVRQLHEACGGDAIAWRATVDHAVLLTHHPPCWLAQDTEVAFRGEICTPSMFFAHLCGHLHESYTATSSVGGGHPSRIWQAPSLFGLSGTAAGEDRIHGYLGGEFCARPDAGVVRLYPRSAVRTRSSTWRVAPDQTFEINEQGYYEEVIQSETQAVSGDGGEGTGQQHVGIDAPSPDVAPGLSTGTEGQAEESDDEKRYSAIPRAQARVEPRHRNVRLTAQ